MASQSPTKMASSPDKGLDNTFPRVPCSTYRFQFQHVFKLSRAIDLLDYIHDLGISDIYSSPLLAARFGSNHCYDVLDHSMLNPEITTEEEFIDFSKKLKERDMGILSDLVPNHLGVFSAGYNNKWFLDVCENGQASMFSHFFDIDWDRHYNKGKLIVPFLAKPIGNAIEDGELVLFYKKENGSFLIRYFELTVPIDPATYYYIFELLPQSPEVEELVKISKGLPLNTETNPAKKEERLKKTTEMKSLIMKMMSQSSDEIDKALKILNGSVGNPKSFDKLFDLTQKQAWRLCYWSVGPDEVNYRRFFDVCTLMAVRVEDKQTFDETHNVILRHARAGRINGIRVDHPDGLHDPVAYLADLQAALHENTDLPKEQNFYLLIEKILEPGERLDETLPVYGTTGYEFMNDLNAIYVDIDNTKKFTELYEASVYDCPKDFETILYNCKKFCIDFLFEAELTKVAIKLEEIAKMNRKTMDFTYKQLKAAVAEVVACFPVYRTYITLDQGLTSSNDIRFVKKTIDTIQMRCPTLDPLLFEFICNIFQCKDEGCSEEEKRKRRLFVMKVQQLTGPVMAKGLEDTAFYRYFMLASLNEVGGQPDRFGIQLEEFHRENLFRNQRWNHTMSSSSTHDTKRSEDVRARLNVLSEIPDKFFANWKEWQQENEKHRVHVSRLGLVPSQNDQYFLYQTLLGGWPLLKPSDEEWKEFKERVLAYMTKSAREAKLFSTHPYPKDDYENAMRKYTDSVLESSKNSEKFLNFQREVSNYGKWNSISHTIVKITSPGIPDIYQGNETYDYSLVDPDNRRPVDYETRQNLLKYIQTNFKPDVESQKKLVYDLTHKIDQGSLKLFATRQSLQLRRRLEFVFKRGDYNVVSIDGKMTKHVVAFSRQYKEKKVVVVTGRFFTTLCKPDEIPNGAVWGDTNIKIEGEYKDAITGITYKSENAQLFLKDLFSLVPFCLLESTN